MTSDKYCLQHIGIPTEKYAETIAFYEKLGFLKNHETMNKRTNKPVAFMKRGKVEFEIYGVEETAMAAGAIDHIAINVADVTVIYEELLEKNIPIIEGITFLPFKRKGVRFFIIEGPNKEKIEFNQEL